MSDDMRQRAITRAYLTADAMKHGLPAAIILYGLRYWCRHNEAVGNPMHLHDGRWWTYNTSAALAEIYPELSAKQVYSSLHRLEDDGAIASAKYSAPWNDQTKWYTVLSPQSDTLIGGREDTHLYNLGDAMDYGVPAAPILYNLRFWVSKREAEGALDEEGRAWVRYPAAVIASVMPEYSASSIKRRMRLLEEAGAIASKELSAGVGDHAKWYTVAVAAAARNPSSNRAFKKGKSSVQKGKIERSKRENVLTDVKETDITSFYPISNPTDPTQQDAPRLSPAALVDPMFESATCTLQVPGGFPAPTRTGTVGVTYSNGRNPTADGATAEPTANDPRRDGSDGRGGEGLRKAMEDYNSLCRMYPNHNYAQDGWLTYRALRERGYGKEDIESAMASLVRDKRSTLPSDRYFPKIEKALASDIGRFLKPLPKPLRPPSDDDIYRRMIEGDPALDEAQFRMTEVQCLNVLGRASEEDLADLETCRATLYAAFAEAREKALEGFKEIAPPAPFLPDQPVPQPTARR